MKNTEFEDTNESIVELINKLDHRTLALWATDCAEHVLPYFEEKFPKDKRPRNAIEAGRAWVRGDIKIGEARKAAFAAHAAARDAKHESACAAARAAGHAAATAHVLYSCDSCGYLCCQGSCKHCQGTEVAIPAPARFGRKY